MPTAATSATIQTARLDLVVLPLAWLDAAASGSHPPELGFIDPHGFLPASAPVIGYRRAQLRADPTQEPWLLRAVVWRATTEAVGYVNFHAPPDHRGAVEIGYAVVPPFRGRGIATEAAHAMWGWARDCGTSTLRASIAPGNPASLALIRRAGFVKVAEHDDPEDGLELVFERPVDTDHDAG